MKLFALDSPVMEGFRKLADVIICNVLFVLCSLPIITAGASLAALYESMQILIADTDNGLIFLDFFKAFKKHFKRGSLMWLLVLAAGVVLYLYYRAIGTLGGGLQKTYTVTFYAILIVAAFVIQYIYPMLVYRRDGIFATVKNAVTLSVVALPCTLLSIGLLALSLVLSGMVYYQSGYGIIFLWIVCGFGLVCYMNGMLFNRAMKRLNLECQNPAIRIPEDEEEEE